VISKTARFQVRREGLEKALAAIREFVAYVAANEPGTVRYDAFSEVEEPTRFLHVFTFRDAEAERVHSTSHAVERFTSVLYPLCVEPVRFTDLATVATTESRP
jgi:quinol monooxygenase YgiN